MNRSDGPVIDPTEILIDRSGAIKEDSYHANPWIRLLARFFDYGCFLGFLLGVQFLLHGRVPLGKFEALMPIEFFAWIPIEALLLTLWGTTPGKWFLKVKLRQGRRWKFPYQLAIKRSFNVWLRGLGMMIPVINGFCLLIAYYRLKALQTTTWDREDHIVVSHSPIARWRSFAAAFFAALVLFLYFNWKTGSSLAS